MSRFGEFKELWRFLKCRKRYWLIPIVLVMVFLGLLIIFAQTSSMAPFIYTFF